MKLQPTDLQIGDWVLIEGIPEQITGVDEKYVHLEGNACERLIEGLIEPIPLTKEILEKNGFVKSHVFVEWKYEDDNLYMLWKPFPYIEMHSEDSHLSFPCEYVHELQHALRLCGITKTIEL